MAEVMTCPTCGVCYSVPDVWLTARRESHDAFYCPNGHPANYKEETEAERLSREFEELRKRLNSEKEELRKRLESESDELRKRNTALYDEVKRLREIIERRNKRRKK
jgi:hypothetical protein